MKPIRLVIFFCISFFVLRINAQPVSYSHGIIPTFGISFQYHVAGELGMAYGIKDVFDESELAQSHKRVVFYPKLATEFYFTPLGLYLGPKAQLELSWKWVTARTSMIYYADVFGHRDLRFTPEIGLQLPLLRGLPFPSILFYPRRWQYTYTDLNLYYGYNIPVGDSRIDNIPGNRVTITFNPILYK